jgi:hypothetical protein
VAGLDDRPGVGLSFGSTLRTMLPPVLASIARTSATHFSLLPSVTSVV